MESSSDVLDKVLAFFIGLEDKNKKLEEVVINLIDKEIKNAEKITEKLIEQEIAQSISLLNTLKTKGNKKNELIYIF